MGHLINPPLTMLWVAERRGRLVLLTHLISGSPITYTLFVSVLLIFHKHNLMVFLCIKTTYCGCTLSRKERGITHKLRPNLL